MQLVIKKDGVMDKMKKKSNNKRTSELNSITSCCTLSLVAKLLG